MGTQGRHRAARRRSTPLRRAGVAAAFVAAATVFGVTWPGAAQADPPVQTGWWNAVSGGGQAAPSPTTPAGGLHVAVVPGRIAAYGAVLYALPAGATATLELKLTNLVSTPQINPTAPSTTPAVSLQACPTKDVAWKAGDDQPMADAPAYDCSLHSYFGNLSADGSTVTFLLDSSAEQAPGELSVAIVPVTTDQVPGVGTDAPTDTTQPFSLDIVKPDASSLTITGAAPLPPAPAAGGGAATGQTGAGSTTTAGAPSSGSGGSTAASAGGVSVPTLPTDTTATTVGQGAAPVVAGTGTTTAPAAVPAAAVTPNGSNTAHNAALAMLILIGIAVVAMSSNQTPHTPRLLGGASRHAPTPALAGAAAGVAVPQQPTNGPAGAVVPMAIYAAPRGLGRFAKQRTAPPRPLI